MCVQQCYASETSVKCVHSVTLYFAFLEKDKKATEAIENGFTGTNLILAPRLRA